MPRTNATLVRAVIEVPESLDLATPIMMAGALTDYVVSRDTEGVLTDSLLISIETMLAAHFTCLREPQYRSKSLGRASGQFIRAEAGMGLEATDWGQQAILLDLTKTLLELSENYHEMTLDWLGKPADAALEWWDRNGVPFSSMGW